MTHERNAQGDVRTPVASATTDAGVVGLGRSIMWSYAATLISLAGSLVIVALTARELGLAALGTYGAASILLALLAAVDFGLSLHVVRAAAVAVGPGEALARREITVAHSCYLVLGGIALALAWPLAGLLFAVVDVPRSLRGEALVMFVLLGLSSGLSLGTGALHGLTAGHGRYDVLARAALCGTSANLLVVAISMERLGIAALGLGQLCAVVVSRDVLRRHVRRNVTWWRWRPVLPSRQERRTVTGLALPVLALAGSVHLITAADALVVGAVSGAAGLGLFRLGSVLPTQALSILLQGYDAVLPVLARSTLALQQATTIFLTRLALFSAGAGLGLLVVFRDVIIEGLAGGQLDTAASVLVITAMAAVANVAIHGWALLLIARSSPQVLLPLVACETAGNVLLTLLLVPAMGPRGAALATLIAVGVSNVLVLPLILGRADVLRQPLRRVVGDLVVFAGAGALLAATIGAITSVLGDGLWAAATAALLTVPLAAGLVWGAGGSASRAILLTMSRSARQHAHAS